MALYTKLTQKDFQNVFESYGLPATNQIKGIVEGTVNTYYQLTYPNRNLYLKVDEVADLKRLKRELKILKILDKLNLTYQFPKLCLTKDKKKFIPYKNKSLLLFEEVEGQSYFGKNLNEKRMESLGRALAELHKKTKNINLAAHRFHYPELKRVYQEIKKPLQKKHPSIDMMIQKILKELQKERPKNVPEGLIHADLFPENVFFQSQKVSGILDFEAAGKGSFLFDIAVTLHACCHNGKAFQKNKIRAFLKGYESYRQITIKEKKSLLFFMKESCLRFLLTRLRDFELKPGKVKASPFKDYQEYVKRFDEITGFII